MQFTDSDMDTDSDADPTDRPQHVRPAEEEELLDCDLEPNTADLDQAFSEE